MNEPIFGGAAGRAPLRLMKEAEGAMRGAGAGAAVAAAALEEITADEITAGGGCEVAGGGCEVAGGRKGGAAAAFWLGAW